jgi:DNA-binding XRE family transcriptional regulator
MAKQFEKRIEKLESLVKKQGAIIYEMQESLEDKWAHEVIAAHDPNEETFPASIVHQLLDDVNPIKVYRNHRNLTQAELGAAINSSKAYISQLETGRRNAGKATLRKLAKALDVDTDMLT